MSIQVKLPKWSHKYFQNSCLKPAIFEKQGDGIVGHWVGFPPRTRSDNLLPDLSDLLALWLPPLSEILLKKKKICLQKSSWPPAFPVGCPLPVLICGGIVMVSTQPNVIYAPRPILERLREASLGQTNRNSYLYTKPYNCTRPFPSWLYT